MANITKRKSFALPGIVSLLFPGFGQLVKGHFFKAIGVWVLGAVLAFLPSWWIFTIPAAILYIANVVDAFISDNSEKLF